MSDENNYLNTNRTFQLRMDVLGLMLKGAAYAAIFILGAWLFVTIFVLIGKALPEQSKEALDPTPLSFNEYVMPVDAVQYS